MKKNILVFGSVCIDNTVFTNVLPNAGTTVKGNSYFSNVGGKGANQACASLFLGGKVTFLGAVGKDDNGERIKQFLKEQKLSSRIKESDKATGVAFITLEEKSGENRIIIVQGANLDLTKEDIDKNSDLFKEGDILLTQLETPIETVEYVLKLAHDKGMIVILNPAPVGPINTDTFKYVDYLVPNEHELEQLSDTSDIEKGAEKLLKMGAKNVIVTLGEKGSLLITKEEHIYCPPHKVEAVDTTAAGDSYLGALVTKLAEGKDILDAMKFATLASSITVTRKGAIVALPHLEELK